MTAIRTIAWLTWRQLFVRRRIWLAVAIALVPFLLTFLYRLTSEDREGDRLDFMLLMNREIILGVLLSLCAVIFGTTAFGGEVDDGTLIYTLVRPVPRWIVVAVKFAVAFAITFTTIAVATLLPWLSLRNAELPGAFLWGFVAAAFVGALLYSALFTYVGLVTKRGLVLGLGYVIFFENVLTRNLEGVKSLSIREFTVSVADWAGKDVVTWATPGVTMATVWTMGTIILVGTIAAAMRKLARYEMAERL